MSNSSYSPRLIRSCRRSKIDENEFIGEKQRCTKCVTPKRRRKSAILEESDSSVDTLDETKIDVPTPRPKVVYSKKSSDSTNHKKLRPGIVLFLLIILGFGFLYRAKKPKETKVLEIPMDSTKEFSQQLIRMEKAIEDMQNYVSSLRDIEQKHERIEHSLKILTTAVKATDLKVSSFTFDVRKMEEVGEKISLFENQLNKYVDSDTLESRLLHHINVTSNAAPISVSPVEYVAPERYSSAPPSLYGHVTLHALNDIISYLWEDIHGDGLDQVNWASSSMGAEIVPSLTTLPYNHGEKFEKLLKVAVKWTMSDRYIGITYPMGKPPEVVLENKKLSAGYCYSFGTPSANITIHLPRPVIIKEVVIQHIIPSLIPKVDKAPKSFNVYGYVSPKDQKAVALGSFSFDYPHIYLQRFPVLNPHLLYFRRVKFEFIKSESAKWTCIYKIRVHGIPLQEDTISNFFNSFKS